MGRPPTFFATASVLAVVALLFLASSTYAVDRSKFKTCSQNCFCKRQRVTSRTVPSNVAYRVVEDSIQGADGHSGRLVADLGGGDVPLVLEARIYRSGVARVR